MILKQLTVENYEKFRAETKINFNTTGITVFYGSSAASGALLAAVNWTLYGKAETPPHERGEALGRVILGYDGKEFILSRRTDGARESVHPVIFGLREDAVTEKDAADIVAKHHSPVWNSDEFVSLGFSSPHVSDVLREKLVSARLRDMSAEESEGLLAEAKTHVAPALEKQANQTITQFRFLCDDNDIAGWERFGAVKIGEELSFAAENKDLTYSEKYLYSMLFFLAEIETMRKIFSKNYCDFIMLKNFLDGVDSLYWPAAAYFLSRWRQQAFITCTEAAAEKFRPLLPPETVWYECREDGNGYGAKKMK